MIISDHLIVERFVRSSGPGGQNVNKVSTAVELRFNLPASNLPDDIKERLKILAGSRVTTEGWVLIEAKEHRTQAQNREAARARLQDLVSRASRRPKRRRATRPTKASRERRLESKQRQSAAKRRRNRVGADD